MNTIYFASAVLDKARRKLVHEGELFVLSPFDRPSPWPNSRSAAGLPRRAGVSVIRQLLVGATPLLGEGRNGNLQH